jgi:N6-L-threonylcarbamoyladenine synthase
VNALIREAITEAAINPIDIDVVCYTKGPGMGGPLRWLCIYVSMYYLYIYVSYLSNLLSIYL